MGDCTCRICKCHNIYVRYLIISGFVIFWVPGLQSSAETKDSYLFISTVSFYNVVGAIRSKRLTLTLLWPFLQGLSSVSRLDTLLFSTLSHSRLNNERVDKWVKLVLAEVRDSQNKCV